MTPTARRAYLALLMRQPAQWLWASLTRPSVGMGAGHIALHKIALRRKGLWPR